MFPITGRWVQLEFNGAHPNLDYLHLPTRAYHRRLRASFEAARSLGANTLRVFVELADVMAGPTTARPETLRALRTTLREADRAGLLLDVTIWYLENLEQFLSLRTALGASAPLPLGR